MGKWYVEYGDQGDIVLNSSVSLTRNIVGYPFASGLSEKDKYEIAHKVIAGLDSCPFKLNCIDMADLPQYFSVSFAEKHLISPSFTAAVPGRVLLLSDEENISIMLCEDDHIAVNSICAGFSLDKAYTDLNSIDCCLEKKIPFAFDEHLGYLTQNPSVLGTAMIPSVMLHLPALANSWELIRLAPILSELGFTLNGSFGEGMNSKGDMYILSNTVTLGISEKDAINNLKAFTLQIATKERAAREQLIKDASFAEKIHRAYGILNTADSITSDDMMSLMSLVRIGSSTQMLPVRTETVNELLVMLQPATLNAGYDTNMSSTARDALRANIIRMRFSKDSKVLN